MINAVIFEAESGNIARITLSAEDRVTERAAFKCDWAYPPQNRDCRECEVFLKERFGLATVQSRVHADTKDPRRDEDINSFMVSGKVASDN